ncbi:hypothetical protein D9B85_14785, partial [Corynebacterium diphtheriae]
MELNNIDYILYYELLDTVVHADVGVGNASKHDLDRQGTAQLSVALEHPVPLLPNAKIKYVNLDSNSEQSTVLNASDIELNNIDYILYYELLDTVVHADVGVG